MTSNGRTAAVGATTTTADELHVPGGSTNDPTPTARVCLQPGSVGWWVLSVEGRPAVKFRDPVHAALTLRDVAEDLGDGFRFWKQHDDGRYTRVTAVYLQAVAEGNLPAARLAATAQDSRGFTVCKGW
ncbi:hypothetical protein [Corynebacterium variabile]|uniref:hypothetical protein n=1 Tax=Corynebacterium variabile TaxID=1727 RepID=UPI0028B0C31C|nr:hypothetical protein [Corynebacterium variabile]